MGQQRDMGQFVALLGPRDGRRDSVIGMVLAWCEFGVVLGLSCRILRPHIHIGLQTAMHESATPSLISLLGIEQ
jgi:hypothetical protein